MQDQQAAAVGGGVDQFLGEVDLAEGQLAGDELAHEAVVVAGEVADAGAAPGLGDDGADDAALVRSPVEAGAHFPAVEDVADQVELFAVVALEEIGEAGGLAAGRAEVDVGNPEGAVGGAAADCGHAASRSLSTGGLPRPSVGRQVRKVLTPGEREGSGGSASGAQVSL